MKCCWEPRCFPQVPFPPQPIPPGCHRAPALGSLCQENHLEREMAIHSSTLAWKIQRLRTVKATVHGIAKSQTRLGDFTFSRLVVAFLPRSKHLLMSRLKSTTAMILEPKKIKSVTVTTVSPSIYHEMMGPDTMILVY